MKILVIGSGGREHALVWKLAQSPHIKQMWCAPGNAGMAQERLAKNSALVECINISADDLPKLLAFAQEKKIELTVVGPDNPLALGIVDLFQKNGLRIWGPNQKAAQFESSKVFSQNFMEKYGIPTARAGTFSDAKTAKKFATSLGGKCAVKADGLALGKGVLICASVADAEKAIDEILVAKSFGAAGAKIVIQEFLEGVEISLHAICDGKTAKLFPTSQDHKRSLDGDKGLNTGGMGTYSPTPFLSDAELKKVGDAILTPWLRGCDEEKIDFRGILYPGVILTKSGAKVLEFNARFGDPETQVYLTRLENDLIELLDASVNGTLDKIELKWKPEASVCVVMASGGYPGNYEKGKPIRGLDDAAKLPDVKVFHAGTAKNGDEIVTNGGRVLGVTAWAKNLKSAQVAAYAAVGKIQFDGAHFRRDIAVKALPKPRRTRCYICGDLLIPIPKGYNGRLQAKHATNDHVPPDGIFNDPKPSKLITVPCCYECNSKHSGFDERLRAFAAIEIGKNKGGEKILFEKVIGSTMEKARQRRFFTQLAESLRDKIVMTSEGPKKVTVASIDKNSVINGVADIAKGLLANYYPEIDYFNDHFEVLDIHNATLAKGHAVEQLNIVREIASKTPQQVIGNLNEFRFWHYVESNVRCGAWLLVFYESVAFVVFHHPQSYKPEA